jgi:hypothetical protein
VDPSDELRRIEREARREQAAAEAEAVQLERSRRSLTDFVWSAMQEGRRIRVAWHGGELVGDPVHVAGNLVVVRSETSVTAFYLGCVSTVSIVSAGSRETVTVGGYGVGSFEAWCRMAEGVPSTVILAGLASVSGPILAVASDHLLVGPD